MLHFVGDPVYLVGLLRVSGDVFRMLSRYLLRSMGVHGGVIMIGSIFLPFVGYQAIKVGAASLHGVFKFHANWYDQA